ncbi:Low specificity L-threonine aldolase [Piscirickettsia salmonis]|uniref:threonine aldolase family protein n=1 Tax=Piscirickettsia salmonis TaxID=1238 RepID=UPI0012BAE9C9|nr:beta-eliminating lyase-related protein [Piscirickettsia salmonis]QGP52664.1 Low specificity L-threonine aldolase [Piscirickettsia salmonis]QGP57518.1 Low specificity L-threonine aldolase [Piscirickettsia salmonis]QGP62232.1 Low specificity L-threonine aldolase [Piscirickettsia salmonis]
MDDKNIGDKMKAFASDNYAGVAPEIMAALVAANHAHQPSYGEDALTKEAIALIRQQLGDEAEVFFVYNGTAANTLALKALLKSHESVICPNSAHIVNHEVGAVTAMTGAMCLQTENLDGKITPAWIEEAYQRQKRWGHQATLPRVVSITQATEFGTVYQPVELAAISEMCQRLGLYLHMDGCRIYNAAAALNVSLAEITSNVGVDVLSLGGTKNGLMFGEAVVFLNPQLAENFAYIQKQGLQLQSKMRFIAAQFVAFFKENLWQKYARQANQACQLLAEGLTAQGYAHFHYPVQTNHVFVRLNNEVIARAQKAVPFYIFDEKIKLARLVTSFDTDVADIKNFLAAL